MSVSATLLQVVSLALGAASDGPVSSPDRAINSINTELVMMADSDYFAFDSSMPTTSLGKEYHGALFLLHLFSYFDTFATDSVMPEANDFPDDSYSPSNPTEIHSPLYMYCLDALTSTDPHIIWINNFLSTSGLTYNYAQNPQNYPLADDGFYYYAIDAYFASRGYTAGSNATSGDYCVTYGRQYYFEGWVNDRTAHLKASVDNNWPCIFTVNGVDLYCDYPYFCIGYYETTYYDPILDRTTYTYQWVGYNPATGIRTINQDKVVKSCSISLNLSHVHSNNLHDSTGGHYYCGCGQLVDCDTHDLHYVRLNALYHRATCADCGYSFQERHSGRYCICQLAD